LEDLVIDTCLCLIAGAAGLIASVLPILIISGLCAYAGVIALTADKRRSRRALLVLRDLLTTLGKLSRRGRR